MAVHDPRPALPSSAFTALSSASRFAADAGAIGMPHPDGERDESSDSGRSAAAPDAEARAGWRAIAPGLLLVVIAGLAYFSLRNLPGSTDGGLGPGSMPRILAAILFVLGAVVAVEAFVGRRVGVSGGA
jgi:hypothetical protein